MRPTKESARIGELVDYVVDRYGKIESTLPLLNREMSATERKALKVVARAKRITIGNIGQALGAPPSTTTWLVNNMVGRMIFKRERDKADRRKTWISLDAKGEALAGLTARISDRIAADILYKLDPLQRDTFVSLVENALGRINKKEDMEVEN